MTHDVANNFEERVHKPAQKRAAFVADIAAKLRHDGTWKAQITDTEIEHAMFDVFGAYEEMQLNEWDWEEFCADVLAAI